VSVKNEYGEKYLEAVRSLIKDIKEWKDILEIISGGGTIKKSDFEKVDWFPTKTYISRYLPEIVKIVNCRKKLYSRDCPETIIRKYKGSENLLISKEDNKKYLEEIKRLISDERKEFLTFMNDKKIPLGKRAEILMRRRYVNRFTIN